MLSSQIFEMKRNNKKTDQMQLQFLKDRSDETSIFAEVIIVILLHQILNHFLLLMILVWNLFSYFNIRSQAVLAYLRTGVYASIYVNWKYPLNLFKILFASYKTFHSYFQFPSENVTSEPCDLAFIRKIGKSKL